MFILWRCQWLLLPFRQWNRVQLNCFFVVLFIYVNINFSKLVHFFTTRSKQRNCDFSVFFVCESNISGTAERICAKFIKKTCFVPRSDEFECQGQRSRSPGTKMRCALPSPPAATEWNALAANNVKQQQTGHSVAAGGWFRQPACGLCSVKHL